MKTRIYFSLAVVVATIAVSAADALTETFQKGLFEEEANRNLDAAIQAYQSVLKQLDTQRKIAATTVFRLGECYRKLGQTNDAATQFQRVLREFSDQEILVNLSRQNLSVLGRIDDPKRKPDLLEIPLANEEKTEIDRIQALITNSPDLINIHGQGQVTPLQKAAQNGHLTVARFLLQNRADVDGRGMTGRTPLHYAVEAGNKTMVELLLQHRADVNAAKAGTEETALHIAVNRGYRAVAEALIAGKADVNAMRSPKPDSNSEASLIYQIRTTPLHEAVVLNDARLVELLLARGARVSAAGSDGVTVLHLWAAAGGAAEIGRALLAKKPNLEAVITGAVVEPKPHPAMAQGSSSVNRAVMGRGFTPLHWAAMNGRTDAVRLLIAAGANVNATATADRTPLNLASVYANTETVSALLEKGAKVNAVATDDTSFPLHAAVARRLPDMLEAILARKPNLELRDNQGYTPLVRAVLNGDVVIAKSLLDAGADPNAPTLSDANRDGFSALHFAVQLRNRQLVELLLEHKANVVAVDRSGKTPLDYAAERATTGPAQPGVAPSLTIPQRTPRQGAVASLPTGSPPAEPSSDDIATLLRKAGGKDDLHRLTSIRIGRQGNFYPVFSQRTNELNRYSLFDLIGSYYRDQAISGINPGMPMGLGNQPNSSLPFPDFARVVIRRLSPDGETQIKTDVEAAFQLGDCSKNMWLEWGDVVEIPEADHRLNTMWERLPVRAVDTLKKCLSRSVQIVVKGQTNEATLNLIAENSEPGFQTRLQQIVRRQLPPPQTPGLPSTPTLDVRRQLPPPQTHELPSTPGLEATPAPKPIATTPDPATPPKVPLKIGSFRLKEVLYGSNLLLTSSDLTRVKVTRLEPASGTKKDLVLNLEQTDAQADLWLRDGDVIEVPERK